MKNYPLEMTAFHGTFGSAATKIMGAKTFSRGKFRRNHWLGQGAYFFREDEQQAMIWALHKVKGSKELQSEDAVVIKSLIKVSRDEFFNLDSREDLERFEKFVNDSIQKVKEKHRLRIEEDEDPHVIRCAFCDQLPQSYKLIQRTFLVDSPRFDNNQFFMTMDIRQHGVQLCVRDMSIIDRESIDEVQRKVNQGTFEVSNRRKTPRTFG